MNALKFLLLIFSFTLLSFVAAAQTKYSPDDITTQTGTFPVTEEKVAPTDEQPLRMQSEQEQREEELELDSFGEDEFNQNVDPDSLDDNETYK